MISAGIQIPVVNKNTSYEMANWIVGAVQVH